MPAPSSSCSPTSIQHWAIDRLAAGEAHAVQLASQVNADEHLYRKLLSAALHVAHDLAERNRRLSESLADARAELRRYTAAAVRGKSTT